MSACLLCGEEPAVVVVPVGSGLADAFAFPRAAHLGELCHALLIGGDDRGLAARLTDDFDDFGAAQAVAMRRVHPGEVLRRGRATQLLVGRQLT